MLVVTAMERADVRQALQGGEGRRGKTSSGEELHRDGLVARIDHSEEKGSLGAQEWLPV